VVNKEGNMKDWQQRVVDEHQELADRRNRLYVFLASEAYDELPIPEQVRLSRQKLIMDLYLQVLDERINEF
jgi:hypothetical protein